MERFAYLVWLLFVMVLVLVSGCSETVGPCFLSVAGSPRKPNLTPLGARAVNQSIQQNMEKAQTHLYCLRASFRHLLIWDTRGF